LESKDKQEVTSRLARYGESWQFSLDEVEVEPMLAKFGFRLLDIRHPQDLEQMYFKDAQGRIVGHVNEVQSIVMAERVE
jgi:hypothetical protein